MSYPGLFWKGGEIWVLPPSRGRRRDTIDKWVLLALSRTGRGIAPHGDDDNGNDPCLRFRRSDGRLALDQLYLVLARAGPIKLTTEGGWVYPADRQGSLGTDEQRHRAVYEQPLQPSMPTTKRLRATRKMTISAHADAVASLSSNLRGERSGA